MAIKASVKHSRHLISSSLLFKCITDINQIEVEEWEHHVETFVNTPAARSILTLIQKNSCVTVTGTSGKGKSASIHYVAIYLRDYLGYQIVPCHSPSDIRNFYRQNMKQVFVIDDICGKYTLIQTKVNAWKDFETSLRLIFRNSNGHTKILSSCRSQIFEEAQFKRLKLFTNSETLCDLSSESYALTDEDLIAIASKYIPENIAENIRNELSNYEFLPLMFTLYQSCYEKNPDLTLKEFLENPFNQYTEEMNELQDAEDKTKYCALFFLIVYNGYLCKKNFTGEESINSSSRRKDIFDEFGIVGTKLYIFEQLYSLLRLFVKAKNDKIEHYVLVPIHDKMFDFLCNYFGQYNQRTFITFAHIEIFNNRTQFVSLQEKCSEFAVMIESENEEIYFNRIVKDLLNGTVNEVFYNQQMKFGKYRSSLINHMQKLEHSVKTKVINVASKSGWTFLMHACNESYDDISRFLIKEKACIDTVSSDGQSAIRIACNKDQPKIVQLLLRNGANPNACFVDRWTLLTDACFRGNITIVELLLTAGAKVNLANENGDTSLTSSVVFGHLEVMKLLAEKGATLNISDRCGVNPMTAACFYGHIKLVDFLISKGVDINEADAGRWTPLMYASLINDEKIIELLIAKGANKGHL